MAASRLSVLRLGTALALAASAAAQPAASDVSRSPTNPVSPPISRDASRPRAGDAPAGVTTSCRLPTGWDLACLRARYTLSTTQWPAPTIDPGVAWTEWGPVPAASAPALQWTAANAGQRELATDLAKPTVVALGQRLFFDPRLSRKAQVSCASCHMPARAFTDGRPLAVGEDGLMGRRRSTPLYAAPYAPRLFWDGRAATLKEQVMSPLHDPREMNHDAAGAVARLGTSAPYQAEFLRAFGAAPTQGSPIDADRLARALAAYVATLRPTRTRFDDFIEGRTTALDDAELLGLHLFRTQARCMNCHSGALLSDHRFHNLGLSFYGRRNQDLGRYEATRDPADLGKFRTPSLRHVARAGPWMHNGLFPDLKGLLRMYNAGMGPDPAPRDPPDPLAPRKSEHIRPLALSEDEIDALLAFMKTL